MLALIQRPCAVPAVEPLLDGAAFWLREDVPYTNHHGTVARVPSDFVFDGYSVPFIRKFVSTGGWNIGPAVLHDWQYATGEPKLMADRSLGMNMRRSGEDENAALLAAVMVMLVGWMPYAHYATLRRNDPYFVQSRLAATRERAEFLARTITL